MRSRVSYSLLLQRSRNSPSLKGSENEAPPPPPLLPHPTLLGNEENRSECGTVMWLVGGGGLPIPEGLTSAWEECARGREGGVEPGGGGPQLKAQSS